MIKTRPQMIGVQAEGAKPLVVAFETGQQVQPMDEIQTLADGIAVGHPRDALKALRAVRDSKGKMISVSDDEILKAMKILARNTGVFAESAGAAAFAGLLHMARQEEVAPHERVAIIVTGNGLKDVDSAIRAVGKPLIVEPVFEDIRKVVEKKL